MVGFPLKEKESFLGRKNLSRKINDDISLEWVTRTTSTISKSFFTVCTFKSLKLWLFVYVHRELLKVYNWATQLKIECWFNLKETFTCFGVNPLSHISKLLFWKERGKWFVFILLRTMCQLQIVFLLFLNTIDISTTIDHQKLRANRKTLRIYWVFKKKMRIVQIFVCQSKNVGKKM